MSESQGDEATITSLRQDLNEAVKKAFESGPALPPKEKPAKRPEFYNGVRVRMPEGYDFSHKNVNWQDYEKDFRLRTDAVWEKTQLKDWFRLFYKQFYFNKGSKRYLYTTPEDTYTAVLEAWVFDKDDFDNWLGYSATGRTTSFQVGLGPKQRVANTFNAFYSMPDYYMLCAMRFERWWRCDMVYYDEKATKYDWAPIVNNPNRYPCYREYYEATFSCADDIFNFLLELAYVKRANDYWEGDHSNLEIKSFPTVYDTPKAAERITFTY